MKNKLQPTRTSFSRNIQCKKAPRWLSKFFSFWYWKSGGPVKKTTLYKQTIMTSMGILCSFSEQIQFCRPLGAYWIILSPTLLSQLDTLVPQLSKLISFQVHQLLVPRTCAPCAKTLRTGTSIPRGHSQRQYDISYIPVFIYIAYSYFRNKSQITTSKIL